MADNSSKEPRKVAGKQVVAKVARPPKAVSKSLDDLSVSERIEKRILDLGDWRGEMLA